MTNPNPSPDVNLNFSIEEIAEIFQALHIQQRALAEWLRENRDPHPLDMANRMRLEIIGSAKDKVRSLIEFYESQEDDE